MINSEKTGLILSSPSERSQSESPTIDLATSGFVLPASYIKESQLESRIDMAEKPKLLLGPSMNRTTEVQAQYEAHVRNKKETGDCQCDMCRLAEQQTKLGVGTLNVTTKELEILAKVLEEVDGEVSFFRNQFPYAIFDGQRVKSEADDEDCEKRSHYLFVPTEHHAEMLELPESTLKAYTYVLPFALKAFKGTLTRNPDNEGASQKGHLHTHFFDYDGWIDKMDYDKDRGTIVHIRGEDEPWIL